jgi:hypothetical protein
LPPERNRPPALPLLALLHLLFGWEASWVGRARVLPEPTYQAA